MSELDDDIARGCLPNGEPIEGRWGTGEWSQMPEQQQEPDPWEEALSTARAEGYKQALDDVMKQSDSLLYKRSFTAEVGNIVGQLKRAYEGSDGNGK